MGMASSAPVDEVDSTDRVTLSIEIMQCQNCYKSPKADEPTLVCGECKHARYCSAACQRENWKAHKKVCPRLGKTFGPTDPPADDSYTVQDVRDFAAVHRTTVSVACVNAMRAYLSPPRYNENEHSLVIVVRHVPAQHNNPAKRFSFVSAHVSRIDELDRRYDNQVGAARAAYAEGLKRSNQAPRLFSSLIVAGSYFLTMPSAIPEESISLVRSRAMPDYEALLRLTIG